MTDLSTAIDAIDARGMLHDVLDQPAQLGDALWRVESAAITRHESPGGLVVCGMGGSAVGGDLAAAAIGRRALRPLVTVRGYELPPWTGPDATVLCLSYSGDTEETLACFSAAGALGATRIALTTGGALAEAARAEGVPVIGVPAGLQPRAAVAYFVVGALECAALCGAAPPMRAEIEAAASPLEVLATEWGAAAPDGSEAKALARRLHGTVPVVHGAGPTVASAWRWKTQLNENAKALGFSSTLPEADHNELCAWERAGELAPMSAVFLADDGLAGRLRRRLDLTAELAAAAGAVTVERVEARGQSPLERVLSLVLLGDLVSVYLAVLRGVDPTPVEAIERFKRSLDG